MSLFFIRRIRRVGAGATAQVGNSSRTFSLGVAVGCTSIGIGGENVDPSLEMTPIR